MDNLENILKSAKFADRASIKCTLLSRRRQPQSIDDYYIRKQRQLEYIPADDNTIRCQKCEDFFIKLTTTNCGHQFCEICLFDHLLVEHKCPVCKTSIKGLQFNYCSNIDIFMDRTISNTDSSIQLKFNQRQAQYAQWIKSRSIKSATIGMEIDVLDTEHIWCVGTIKSIVHNKQSQLLIHYKGWNKIYDEYIKIDSPRLSPLGMYTKRKDIMLYLQNNTEDAISSYVTNTTATQRPPPQNNTTYSILQLLFNNILPQNSQRQEDNTESSSDYPNNNHQGSPIP